MCRCKSITVFCYKLSQLFHKSLIKSYFFCMSFMLWHFILSAIYLCLLRQKHVDGLMWNDEQGNDLLLEMNADLHRGRGD